MTIGGAYEIIDGILPGQPHSPMLVTLCLMPLPSRLPP